MQNYFSQNFALRKIMQGSVIIAALCGVIAFTLRRHALAAPPAMSANQLQSILSMWKAVKPRSSVSPAGKSLLIDTGWPGNNGRDANRIVAAAKLAGVSKLISCFSRTITRTTPAECRSLPPEFR